MWLGREGGGILPLVVAVAVVVEETKEEVARACRALAVAATVGLGVMLKSGITE